MMFSRLYEFLSNGTVYGLSHILLVVAVLLLLEQIIQNRSI